MSDIGKLRAFFNPVSAYAYLLFVLLYLPCLAAFGAALKELGGRYGSLLGVYLIAVAWATATLFYQLFEGGNGVYIGAAVGVLALLFGLFVLVGRTDPPVRRA